MNLTGRPRLLTLFHSRASSRSPPLFSISPAKRLIQWESLDHSPYEAAELMEAILQDENTELNLQQCSNLLITLRRKDFRVNPSKSPQILVSRSASAMMKELKSARRIASSEASGRWAMRVARGLAFQSILLNDDLASSCFTSSFEALTLPLLESAGIPELALMAAALVAIEARPSRLWTSTLVKRASDSLCSFKPPAATRRILSLSWRAPKIPLERISRRNPPTEKQMLIWKHRPPPRLSFLKLKKKPSSLLLSSHISLASAASSLLLGCLSVTDHGSLVPPLFPTLPTIANRLDQLPLSNLPHLIWSIAVMVSCSEKINIPRNWSVGTWSQSAAAALHERMMSMNDPQSLIRSLHALVLLGTKPYDAWLRDMERRLVELTASAGDEVLTFEDLSSLLWCYAEIQREPDYTLTTRIEAHLSQLLPAMHLNRRDMQLVRNLLIKVYGPTIRDKRLRQAINLMNSTLLLK